MIAEAPNNSTWGAVNTGLTAVHVVPYYPPHSGGMEQAAAELVRGLPAAGVTALVLTSSLGADPNLPPEPGVLRLPAIEVAHTPLLRGLIRTLWRMPPGSIVHAHVAHAFIPDLAAAIGHLRGHPVVAHYHLDVDPTGPMGRLLRPYQRTVLRHTLRHAQAVLVPTPDYAQIVTRTYGVESSRVHVLPNGTTFDIAPEPRRSPNRSAPQPTWRLICVGRLNQQKDHALLLRACARLRRLAPELAWSLDIYGGGEEESRLTAMIRELDLTDAVRLRGEGFTPAQMQTRYDDADLFVLATRKESFGIVYVEAMARGLPIVTTDVPGTRNVVRHEGNGLLAPRTAEGLATALHQVMTDSERYEKLSAAGLSDAGRYRWPVTVQRLAEIYRSLQADLVQRR
jgi:glycosyltransferase involved in cell wall biosynthesis